MKKLTFAFILLVLLALFAACVYTLANASDQPGGEYKLFVPNVRSECTGGDKCAYDPIDYCKTFPESRMPECEE